MNPPKDLTQYVHPMANNVSTAEGLLAFQIKAAKLPEPVRQFRYVPGRKFTADFVVNWWPCTRSDTPSLGSASGVARATSRRAATSGIAGTAAVRRIGELGNLVRSAWFAALLWEPGGGIIAAPRAWPSAIE